MFRSISDDNDSSLTKNVVCVDVVAETVFTQLLQLSQVVLLRSRQESRGLPVQLPHLATVDVGDHVLNSLAVKINDFHATVHLLLHVVGEHCVEHRGPGRQDVLVTPEFSPLACDAAVCELSVGENISKILR